MDKPKIVIWGPDNYNALGLLRQLAPANIDVLFLINGGIQKCATKSKFCHSYVLTPSYESGLNYLIENFTANKSEQSILIPIGDRAAEIIDRNRSILSERFILMGTDEEGLLEWIDNKNNMVELASKCGFIVPRSIRVDSTTVFDDVPMPCIIKPTSNEGIREFKTKIIRSRKELEIFRKYLNPRYEYILQELIPKTHDILVYGCRFPDGKVELAGQFIKDRWSDDGGGSHGFLTHDLPDYLCTGSISTFLEEINYTGLFSVEYGLKDSTAYFYEFNLRNDGTSHLFYQAGANLPLAWVNGLCGLGIECSTKITKPGWNINEVYDISNVFHGRISYRQYKQEKKQATIFHYYDADDKAPWKYAKKKAIWDLPLRAFLMKFRPQIIYMKSKLHI